MANSDFLKKLEKRLVHIGNFLTIDLFSLYVLFSQFRPRDVLQGIASCLFINYAYICTWMHVHMTTFERNSSLGAPSCGLKWENKTCKLKRSILKPQEANYHIKEMECSFNRLEQKTLKVVTWPSLSLERSGVR